MPFALSHSHSRHRKITRRVGLVLTVSLATFLATCLTPSSLQAAPQRPANTSSHLGQGYDFAGNGKRELPCFSELYQPTTLPLEENLDFDPQALKLALSRQIPALQNRALLRKSSERLQALLRQKAPLHIQDLNQVFSAQLIRGEDGCGNTHFTAYFSPMLEVKARPDAEYRYPIYAKPAQWPQGQAPTRAEIDQGGALAGQGLELAYAKSLLEIFFLQVQGSGLAEYLDSGERLTLQYDGANGYAYQSVGRFLVDQGYIPAESISLDAIRQFFAEHPDKLVPFLNHNPSYVFFKKAQEGPRGSLHTEVVPQVSIAVDPQYIPLGTLVLAEIPRLDAQGNFLGHQLTLLVAQDTGGAIKGPGHVDLYMGAGAKAQAAASAMHHYGRLWLLQPRK